MELDLGGRKFIFALLVLILGFALTITGKIGFDQFETMTIWTFGIFAAANTVSKFSDITIEKINTDK